MHTLHTKCTPTRAPLSHYSRVIRRVAHFTHIFFKRNKIGRELLAYRTRHRRTPTPQQTCENAVQCVQIAESSINKGRELHSYVCAMLCKVCKMNKVCK
jgi:hypothetical protein